MNFLSEVILQIMPQIIGSNRPFKALSLIHILFANDETIFGALMSMAQDICNLLMTYFVIKGTNAVLQSRGAAGQMELGKRAWRWQLISFGAAFLSGGITLLCLLLSGSLLDSPSLILPLISVFASLAISLVALVYYLRYLKQSSEFLI